MLKRIFVAGIAPASPGYRSIRIAPRPVEGLDRAEASVETPYGDAGLAWAVGSEGLRIALVVPAGTTAVLDLPVGPESVITIDGEPLEGTVIDAGRHDLHVTNPLIVTRGDAAASSDTAQPAGAGARGAIEAW